MLYGPVTVWKPIKTSLLKLAPFCVKLRVKSVASRLLCRTGKSKTPCRALMFTGTLMFVQSLAAAVEARLARAKEEVRRSRDMFVDEGLNEV